MRSIACLLSSCLSLGSAPAMAHPHVWIDAAIEVILDAENRATGVRISWTYDALYSLYVVGDMGLDPDWDGQLTEAETARLSGFDMNWDADFPGDTYALLDEVALPMSRPQDWTASYAGGMITTTHLRTFAEPVALGDEPLILQVYDPSYYTAYVIAAGPVLSGGQGCSAQVFVPDIGEAEAELLAALSEFTPDVDLEAEFPAVGAKFAEEVRVTCNAL